MFQKNSEPTHFTRCPLATKRKTREKIHGGGKNSRRSQVERREREREKGEEG